MVELTDRPIVEKLNADIVAESHEQIYSNSVETLHRLFPGAVE